MVGLFLFAVLLLAPLAVLGARAADADGFDQGLLYRLQPPGGAPSWLFGTIHSDDPRVLDVPEAVLDALAGARTLVLEVVPDAEAAARSMAAMRYEGVQTLEDALPPDLYADTLAALAARGLPASVGRQFWPWGVVLLLSLPESDSGEILDLHLYRRAQAAEQPVSALERVDEQMQVFAQLAPEQQVTLLRETLASLEQMPAIFDALVAAYLARDLAALADIGKRQMQHGDPAVAAYLQTQLLDVRNRRMAERIMPLLQRGGAFIAVGALHMTGSGGLLQRLQAAGVAVERIY
ncbi:TraB/GumN family protein [Thiohalocapsa marina]|nr:TraB/GumN family protein [Thiohalocapsa marina]